MSSIILLVSTATAAALPMQPTRIAVVGGGLAGLSTAAHLLAEAETPLQTLHIYDAAKPGEGGASSVAAGLLHPFTPKGREIWRGLEGYDAAVELIARVEDVAGPCSRPSGLLRLATSDEQAADLEAIASEPRAAAAMAQSWLTHGAACAHAGTHVGGCGASHAPAALCVDVPTYVQGLWRLCESLFLSGGGGVGGGEDGIDWRHDEVTSLRPLLTSRYDAVIVAVGARATSLHGLEELPLRGCRGQNLLLSNKGQLKSPLISGKYVVPIDGGSRLLAGATFEYDETNDALHRPADAPHAEAALGEPLQRLHPAIAAEDLLGVQAGVRCLPPRSHHGYVPIAGRLGGGGGGSDAADVAECWLLGGLGSRGLIHHALMGRQLARAVLRRDASHLPEHARRLQSNLDGVVL